MLALFSCLLTTHVTGIEIRAPPIKWPRTLQQESLLRQYIAQMTEPSGKSASITEQSRTRLHLSQSAADRLLIRPPRYIFGISTGHAGSTSLSNVRSYSGSLKRNITFRFEEYFLGFGKWWTWAGTKPSLEEQETKVRHDYKLPIDNLLDSEHTQTYLDLGHHNLLGMLRTMPKVFGDDVFFIRFRRDRVHTAYSFSKYGHPLCKNAFRVCPLTDSYLLSPQSGNWTEDAWRSMTKVQQHLWFIDEVEAEFQRLLRENPDVSYLECNWSDDLGHCFELVSSMLGLQVAENGGVNVMHHTYGGLDRRERDRIVQLDEDYRNVMAYTDAVNNSIREAQF